ncbi:MAG: YqgE/AlgH family protein [Ignavibacteria bacterium]|nr:YqgE/AlgH family protein [Ignavibacteria bacterium]MCC7158773.1 YqgE/AlgH family protein [Ignavibacteria bacterium]
MPEKPAKGKILISEPFLNDPNFKRTIILLTEHSEEGSVGFVLNKPTEYKINKVIEDFPDFDSVVYYGGPVQLNTLQFIYRGENLIENSIEIMPGLFWGGSFDILKTLIEANAVSPNDFRFFIGYSGWDDGQIEEEMNINSWIVTETSIDNIFSEEPDKLWREILKSMGKKFAILASFPENPSVN